MNQGNNYVDFDAALLNLIRDGINTARELEAALEKEAVALESRPGEWFRVIDRRLQALRRKKAIEPVRQGRHIFWKLAQ